MNTRRNIYAVVPVKDTSDAKRRLAGVLNGTRRQQLALAMCEDVLATLAGVRELAGIVVVTVDPAAAAMAARYGAHVSSAGARELAREGMLTVPADIPLVEGDDIRELIHVHRNSTRGARAFTIVPARDERGSNAILCSPAGAVPLRFGADSFVPHLSAAKRCAIEPTVVRLPRIALDIDTPDDVAEFLATPSSTHARALLEQWRLRLDEGVSPTATA